MGPPLHPLHSVEFVASCLLMTGHYPGERRTGRTTVRALKFVAAAIEQPGVWLKPLDHFGTHNANHYLTMQCRDIVEKLGFEGFTFRAHEMKFG